MTMLDLDTLKPSDLGFDPARYPAFRPGQLEAIKKIIQSDKKYIILQAPTGSGKSLVAASVVRLSRKSAIYCVSSKTLQDQVFSDFSDVGGEPFAAVLKGRNAYPTLNYPHQYPSVSAERCVGKKAGHCLLCCSDVSLEKDMQEILDGKKPNHSHQCDAFKHCPYQVAKRNALYAQFPVLNVSMYLNLTSGDSEKRDADIENKLTYWNEAGWFIGDEAELIEDALMGFVELRVTEQWAKRLGLTPPPRKTLEPDPERQGEAWKKWIQDEAYPAAERRLAQLEPLVTGLNPVKSDVEDTKLILEYDWLSNYCRKMRNFVNAVHDEKWVWMPEQWTFKPVLVNRYGPIHIWNKARRVLLMSGTVISVDQMCFDLGIPSDQIEYVEVPSTFLPSRRPVFYEPVTSMRNEAKDWSFPQMTAGIDERLARHESVKCLVHTHTYEFTRYFLAHSQHKERLIGYTNPEMRTVALESFKKSDKPSVFVAPSMERGLDLPGSLCRAIILAKVPYPNLNDKQVQQRLYAFKRNGRAWYAVQTIRDIVQALGRGVRSYDDYCTHYILDEEFGRLYSEYKHIFPKWWREALHML